MSKFKIAVTTVAGLFGLYIIISLAWSLLNMQTCSYDTPLEENPTCEQIAENNSKNCKYVILRWKDIDPDKDLQACKKWEPTKQQ